jgi:hypothetical protein
LVAYENFNFQCALFYLKNENIQKRAEDISEEIKEKRE